MSIPTTEEAVNHCRADPVADVQMIAIYLEAAVALAEDFLGAKLYESADAMGPEDGIIVDGAVRAGILTICGHLFENRESVVVGNLGATEVPMTAYDLIRFKRRSYGL